MQTAIKLILRFALILLTAQLLQKFFVVLVECSVYAWDDFHAECLSLIFTVGVVIADYIDGQLFKGPSVFDTVISKLRGKDAQ